MAQYRCNPLVRLTSYITRKIFSLHELCPHQKLISSVKIPDGQTRFFPLLAVCGSALQTADLADKNTHKKKSIHFDKLNKIYAQGELIRYIQGIFRVANQPFLYLHVVKHGKKKKKVRQRTKEMEREK